MFLLFAGEDCYPKGGWKDYKGSFETWKEAKAEYFSLYEKDKGNYPRISWGHIVNSRTMKIAVKIEEEIVTQIDPEINLVKS